MKDQRTEAMMVQIMGISRSGQGWDVRGGLAETVKLYGLHTSTNKCEPIC